MSLRSRIYLTLVPLLVLLAALGGAGVYLIHNLGGRIDAILHENYDSVLYMERLKEALERIDSSFTFALAGKEDKGQRQYAEQWPAYLKHLHDEQGNITVPGEAELVEKLASLTERYHRRGDAFYNRPAQIVARAVGLGATSTSGPPAAAVVLCFDLVEQQRQDDYFGDEGLLETFKEIKTTADHILRINQENMEQASSDAKASVRRSLIALGIGVAVGSALAMILAWRLSRSILGPIAAVTGAVRAIEKGNLDHPVPVVHQDEIGQFAQVFNAMVERLKVLRHSNLQRLLRAQQTAQATIDSFPDPVLVVDPEGRVELANPAARQVLGVAPRTEKQPPGPPWIPPEPLRAPLAAALHERRPSLTESFDQVISFRLHGEDRSYLPQVRPVRDSTGETRGAAVVLSDVTRFRLLDQFKTDLVATASHELKTPLSGLRLALYLLLEESVGPLTPKQTELLLDARDNAERLLSLIEHLLALARLEHGAEAICLEPQSPVALLRAAADAVATRAADRHIAIAIDEDDQLPLVAADPVRLGYALNNLLDNSLTYTDPGGKITLSARVADHDKVRLSVADTGVGIPAEYLPQVFQKFFRVPGAAHPPGTGLGLAIVREIILAHGGQVTCESTPGKGTVFHLTLPAWKGDGHEPGK
jgi:signal transduction histidine kinase